jgi:hypothetical protein
LNPNPFVPSIQRVIEFVFVSFGNIFTIGILECFNQTGKLTFFILIIAWCAKQKLYAIKFLSPESVAGANLVSKYSWLPRTKLVISKKTQLIDKT